VGKKPYSVAGFNPPLSYTLREDAHGCADEERFALAHPAPRLAGASLEYKSLKSKYWKSFPPLFCREMTADIYDVQATSRRTPNISDANRTLMNFECSQRR